MPADRSTGSRYAQPRSQRRRLRAPDSSIAWESSVRLRLHRGTRREGLPRPCDASAPRTFGRTADGTDGLPETPRPYRSAVVQLLTLAKGRVERAIRYVRESFFAARTFADLADLNAQALLWCNGQAADRICPADRDLRVRQAFAQEQLQLLPLPDNPFVTDEVVAVHVGKTPYARFDLNDYSVPHTQVQRTVTARATPDRVRILDGLTVIAEHPRSYDRGAQIEDPNHVAELVAHKRRARASRCQPAHQRGAGQQGTA